jgi:hypothetical protein
MEYMEFAAKFGLLEKDIHMRMHLFSLLTLLYFESTANAQSSLALYLDDGETVEGPVKFAAIGNSYIPSFTDRILKRKTYDSLVREEILNDVKAYQPDAIMYLGDQIPMSTVKAWDVFVTGGPSAFPSIPVAGNREYASDSELSRWGGVFPGVGEDIGHNRVGSWYGFSVAASEEQIHQVLVLDSNKKAMGSRWGEQLEWLSNNVRKDASIILVMHESPFDLSLAPGSDAAMELIEAVENSADIGSLKLVLFAGGHSNQMHAPDGGMGILYVGSGGGGAPAEGLMREDGILRLDTRMDLDIMGQLEGVKDLNPDAWDRALSKGKFAGRPGVIDPEALPVYGWWSIQITAESLDLTFHQRTVEGMSEERLQIGYSDLNGWVTSTE